MIINLDIGDTRKLIDAGLAKGLLRNQIAYVLATVYHETGFMMKPITEWGSQQYLSHKSYWPDIGRGYVQLTWAKNYELAATKLGLDPQTFIKDPSKLLDPQYAAPIAVLGMQEGWFTGRKLSDYITLKASDFVHARRIINGMDKAVTIASYATTYDNLLRQANIG